MSLDVSARKKLGGFTLDVSFRSDGEMLGILGASGSGKSMTLKCIAGIETPDRGRIAVGERVLFDAAGQVNIPPQRRRVGYLFQSYALFPHMRVAENIACGIPRGTTRSERDARVGEMVRRFHLEGLERHWPAQLSGGQQQRAALARVMAGEPEVLLLDEPFSALDHYLREQLQAELLHDLQGYAGDVVMVTHSRDEVFRLCPNVMVLDGGRCVAHGPTREVFADPGCVSVARLTGCKNYSRAEVIGPHTVRALDWNLELAVAGPVPPDIDCIGVRAHDFHPVPEPDAVNRFPVRVQSQLENQFEWNVIFSPEAAVEPQDIWWMVSKALHGGAAPEFLMVPPEKILLLREDGAAAGEGDTP